MSSFMARVARAQGAIRSNALSAKLLRGGAGSLMVKVLQAVVTILLTVVLARLLGPHEYGIYSLILSILLLIAIPTQLGTPQLVVRETAKGHAVRDWSLIQGLWRWSNKLTLWFSLLVLCSLFAVLWWLRETIDPILLNTAVAGAALVPLVAMANLRAAALRGLKLVVVGQLPEKVIRPATLLMLVFLTLLLPTPDLLSAPATMALHSFAALLTFFIGWLLLAIHPIAREVTKHEPQAASPTWARSILPLSLIASFQLINSQADLVVLGVFREPEEVGIYRVVSQVSLILVFVLNSVQQVLQPYVAEFYALNDRKRLQVVFAKLSRGLLVTVVFMLLPILIFPQSLLSVVFGMHYSSGALSLQILALGVSMKVVLGLGSMILIMAGQEKAALKVTGITALGNLLLNVLLIPFFGMEGAAVSTALTFFVWSFWLYFTCKRVLELNISPFYRLR